MIFSLKMCYFKSYSKISTNYCYCTGRQAYRSSIKSNRNILQRAFVLSLVKALAIVTEDIEHSERETHRVDKEVFSE